MWRDLETYGALMCGMGSVKPSGVSAFSGTVCERTERVFFMGGFRMLTGRDVL
jgi:hypothetical protein